MIKRSLFFTICCLLFCSSAYAAPTTAEGQSIYVWPRFWQFEAPWNCDIYAGHGVAEPCRVNAKYASNTIAAKGCRITSLAMLLRYHGLTWALDEHNFPKLNPGCEGKWDTSNCTIEWNMYIRTNPGTLDDWIVDKGLYDSDRNPYVQTIVKYYSYLYNPSYTYRVVPNHDCVDNNNNCYKIAWSDPKAEKLLDYDLDHRRPDIMQIKYPGSSGHFVLIGGYDNKSNTYRAYDPGKEYLPLRIDPPSLDELYNGGATTLRIDRYKYDVGGISLSELSVLVYSPVEIQIIDPQGRATGYDPVAGTKIGNIPYASYSEESVSSLDSDEPEPEPAKELYIDKPIAGNYIFKMFGTGDGPYTIKLRGVKEDGTVNLDTSFSGTASVGMSETYKVKYSPTGEATLTQSNEPPVANAGPDQTGEQGYIINLDGSGSSDPDGDPIKYRWSFVSRPSGSTAALSDASVINPVFTPDLSGTYVLQLVVNDYFTDSAPATVTITALPIKSRVSVTPNFSVPISTGSSKISFDVSNTGRIGVSSGIIDISLKDPDGNLVSTGSKAFDITVGENKAVEIPVTIPSLKFGNYTLTYTQSDETRTGSPTTATVSNSASAIFSFDGSTYRMRETATLAVNMTNTGKFNLDNVSVTVSAPDAGYTDTKTINIGQEQALPLQYQIPIPTTITPGQHDVIATLTLPSGSSYSQSANLTVPQSVLRIGHTGPTNLIAGDAINLTIENTGGVDTSYTTESLNITDGKGVIVYQGSITGSVLSGEKKTLADLIVPFQAATGPEYLYAKLKDARTGETTSHKVFLDITGLEAGLSARTDKDTYLNTEAITALSTLATGALGIDNGELDIKVVKYLKESPSKQFTHYLPEKWFVFNQPQGVEVASDGSLYVADSWNHRIVKFDSNLNFITTWGSQGNGDGQFSYPEDIALAIDDSVYVMDSSRVQKFDGNGNFIAKWGSYGSGNGQFKRPSGIAVSPDGFVYVADTVNHRIQKFDSSGNFITKWGSYGSSYGQFNYPHGISIGSDGSVYVVETVYNHRVQKFDSNGRFITSWGGQGTSDGKFYYPLGINVSSDGFVYVADTWNYRIQKFDSNGNFITKWGFELGPFDIANSPDGNVYIVGGNNVQKFDGTGNFLDSLGITSKTDGEFSEPKGLAIDPTGFLYVADSGNNRIQKFDRKRGFVTKWGSLGSGEGQFNYPSGIAFSKSRFIYVADTWNNRIQKFDNSGNFLAQWGSAGNANGQFFGPSSIAVSSDDYVYVADTYNHRIQKFDSSGNFITAWGSYGYENGQFKHPFGITLSSDGYVYVADTYNYRIQKFDGNGNFITMWNSYGLPCGIAVATDGSVYVVDRDNHRIQQFDSNGNILAEWGRYGTNDEQFAYPFGITTDGSDTVYVADTSNNRIQRMITSSNNFETIFETTVPVTQSVFTSQEYATNIGSLDTIGKLYLQASLKNNVGQTIATSEYPFYVFNGNTALLLSTDKKVYRPGETVTITGEVKNLTEITASSLSLKLSVNSQDIYTSTLDLPASGSYQFMATTIAGTEGTVALIGAVSQNDLPLVEIIDGYEVAIPQLSVSISSPDVVGKNSFDLDVEVKNTGKAEFTGRLLLMRDWWNTIDDRQITIPAGETRLLQYSQQIAQTTAYTVNISGDAVQTAEKTVIFGEAATISFGNQKTEKTCSEPVYEAICSNRERVCSEKELIYVLVKESVCQEANSPSVYPEGKVGIPVTITNTGQIDEALTVNLSLQPSGISETRTYYLPKGGSVTDTLYYDLASGSYQLTAVGSQPYAFAQTSFTVLKESDAAMTNVVGSQGTTGLIPITVNLTNNGYDEINGSIQLAVMDNQGKAVWRGEAQVSGLKPLSSMSYPINVDPTGIISGAYKTEIALYNTAGTQLASNQTEIRVSGPIFEITSMPAYPTFTVGREAAFTFTIKNTGTQAGTTDFSVKAIDILNQSVTDTLNPGEEKSHTFNFMVPEDAEEKDYNADYALAPTLSQATSGQSKFRIAGVNIGATATLDKTAYRNGDTAILALTVSKLSQFDDGTYVAIIRYGAYHDMKTFTLTGQPATLTFSVPLTEITGENLFYSIHFESGRTIYTNSLSLNRAQPDLVVSSIAPGAGTIRTQKIEVGVTNIGDLPSEATTLKLYDGEPYAGGIPIAALAVSALAKDESATIIYDWDIIGKGGKRTIYAVIDPDNTVIERMEANNTSSVDIIVPDLTLEVSTTKPQYEANQDVGIAETVVNLTAGTTYSDAVLTTTVKDPAGSMITTLTNTVPVLAPGEASYANSWSTASNRPGSYTINAVVSETPLATASTTFEILPTISAYGDITSPSEVIQGFPFDITYNLTNNGNIDIAQAEVKVEFQKKSMSGDSPDSTALQAGKSGTVPYLAVLDSKTGSISIEKVDVEPGEYIVSLILKAGDSPYSTTSSVNRDSPLGKTIIIASKDLTVKPPLKVTKGISTLPRVLVWTPLPHPNPLPAGEGVNEKIVTDALTKLGAYYTVVHTEAEFVEGMRSGYYNTYALLDTGKPTTDGLTSEIIERVYGGDTLILTGNSNMDDIKISEVTGTKFIGYMADGIRTTAVGAPLYEHPINFTAAGKFQKVNITSNTAQLIGTVSEYPSVIVNQYGKGKGILITFDLGRSSDATNDITTYSALLGRLIGYATPLEVRLVPESVVPIEITVESLGSAFDLRIVEKADSRFTLLDATGGGAIDRLSNTITWDTHLSENQVLRSIYLAGLPMFRNTFNTDAEVYYQNKGEYRLYNTYALNMELTEGVTELQNNILNAISLMTVSKEQQGIKDGIIRDYQSLISRSSGMRKELDKDIHDLLKIMEDIMKLNIYTGEVRAAMNKHLIVMGRRWVNVKQ